MKSVWLKLLLWDNTNSNLIITHAFSFSSVINLEVWKSFNPSDLSYTCILLLVVSVWVLMYADHTQNLTIQLTSWFLYFQPFCIFYNCISLSRIDSLSMWMIHFFHLLQRKIYDERTHKLNDWGLLERFIYLGSESSYNAHDKHPNRKNAECIDRLVFKI
jgi:hypothetical protein